MSQLEVQQLYNIPISDITVSDRDRKDYGEVKELALSIRDKGLLQPISINQDRRLIAGGRRLKAWRLNIDEHQGPEEIPAYVTFTGDDIEVKIKEFGENFHRKPMTWQETAVSVFLLTKRQQEKYGVAAQGARTDVGNKAWGLKDTARVLSIQHIQVVRYIAVIRAFYAGHTDILERDSLYSALQLVKDRREIEALERIDELVEEEDVPIELDKLDAQSLSLVVSKADGEDIQSEEDMEAQIDGSPISHPRSKRPILSEFATIVEGNACELIKEVSSETFDCVLWDPPYGIELGKVVKAKGKEIYSDTSEAYVEFMLILLPELYRVLKADAHIYIFHGPDMFQYTKDSMISAGFDVDRIPWIWNKTNMAGQSNTPDRWPGRVYEPILFGHKGKRPMLQKGRKNVLNVRAVSPQYKTHPTEKPIMLYRALLQNSARIGEIILDPMAGSGACLRAAGISGIRSVGFEQDRGHFLRIKDSLGDELYTAAELKYKTDGDDSMDDASATEETIKGEE